MKPLHVLITADTMGGVWTYARELVTGLVYRGVKVTLVSFGNVPTPQQTAWMEPLDLLDFRPTGFRLEWMQESGPDLEASATHLQSVIDEVRPDLLHLNQFCYGALETDLPKLVTAHSDVIGWFQAVHGTEKDSSWLREYRRVVSAGLSGADVVIAPSQWMLSSLRRNYQVACPAHVIYNGRTPSLFNPYIGKDHYAVSLGRIWDLGKNAVLLTQIDLPLLTYLGGENVNPEDKGEVQAHSRRLIYRGQLNQAQLQHVLSRASIYVATSQYEPFGLAPVEAAFSRCAILASDIPSFRELWGSNAIYFRSNDPESLEAELQRLASDRDRCFVYGKLAYEHAGKHYRAESMVKSYLDAYTRLGQREAMAA
jgi:glycosyltransferase involved in cell wall biosynthesis